VNVSIVILVGIGVLAGLTTVLFGFGGGFVTVPVVGWADGGLGSAAAHVAVATSSVVMVVNACVATAATERVILRQLRGTAALLLLLAAGGAAGTVAARWSPGALTQWLFVAYLAVAIADLLLRPGFFRPRTASGSAPGPGPGPDSGPGSGPGSGRAIPVVLGVPIGVIAAFLGIGGSVLTVPLLRRSGRDMRTATSLANPLTLAIAAPAMAIFLTQPSPAASGTAGVLLTGPVDLGAAAALLAGALPVIVTVRRHRPRIPDGLYSWSYLGLLVLVAAAMIAESLGHG
jgi:uncharacterized membrane protein YfcA